MAAFLTDVGTVLAQAITWVGSVATAFFGTTGALKDLLPFLAISLGLGILGTGVGYIRSFVHR